MCGIFGYINNGGDPLDPLVMKRMGDSLAHRGPDDVGVYQDHAVAMGNRRLSIIDIDGGHQPFVSEDGNVVVVQNGEIYNHVELADELKNTEYQRKSHSDTEVLLRLYQKYGIDFISKLNGMFAIAIYDKRIDTLYLIRDRIGVKPLFFTKSGSKSLFGSEIKSLLVAGFPKNINYEAIHYFLTFNYVPPPYTAISGVEHVMPGHYLEIKNGNIISKRWWNLADQQQVNKSEAQWIEELNDLLDDAVRIRLRSDAPYGAFLSGGVDSSTIVGLMSRHMPVPVKTFSIGFQDKRFDESRYAQIAADRFDTAHTMRQVDINMLDLWPMCLYYCDQPHGDVSFMPTYTVSKLAAEHVKMVLTGDGGDELFAGYDKYKQFFERAEVGNLSQREFVSKYYDQLLLFKPKQQSQLYNGVFAEQCEQWRPEQLIRSLHDEVAHWDHINQALYIDMMFLLPGNNLVKPDRMGMANSLEARTPFLDYRVMELAFTMPGNIKIKNGETKYILKKAARDLIGDELAYRKKQMFTVPVGEWFRDTLTPLLRSMLLSEDSIAMRLFENAEVTRMLQAHESGERNLTREIRALVALEKWFDRYIETELYPSGCTQDLETSNRLRH